MARLYDNAMCESFFATPECELLDRRKCATKTEARMGVFEFIEGWDNPGRRHSALGSLPPTDSERTALAGLEVSSPRPYTKPGKLQLRVCAQGLLLRHAG